MDTTNLPTPPRSKTTPEHLPHNPNIPVPGQSTVVQPPPQPVNVALHKHESKGAHPPPTPRPHIPYLPGPTLEDEKRAIAAQNNLPIVANKNALRPCAHIMQAPAVDMSVDRDRMYERHPVPESPYEFTPVTAPRRPLLEAWRARMGLDLSARSTVPRASRGGLLPFAALDQIVVYMLLDAPPKAHPRTTLKSFRMTSRKFYNLATTYVYQQVTLQGNGDAGVYVRNGGSKYVQSLTIEFDPNDPWNPYSALVDHMLYPSPNYVPGQMQEAGIAHLFPNLFQIAFVARFAPDEARTRWLARAQILGLEFSTQVGPANRSRLYDNPAFLAMRLAQLIPARVGIVTMDADDPALVSKFAVKFITRSGNPCGQVRLDVITRRDEVVQATEFAVHSHVRAPTDPPSASAAIVMYGPCYGTTIMWNGTNTAPPVQTIWRRGKESSKHAGPKETPPVACERLGSGPRHSTRKSTSPYKNPNLPADGSSAPRKRGELMSSLENASKIPQYAAERLRSRKPLPESEVEIIPEEPKGPQSTPEPENIPMGQKCAWGAGNALAEFPNAMSSAFKQVNDSFAQFASNSPNAERIQLEGEDAEYPEFWQFVDYLAGNQSHIGVWHTTARTEVDTFVTAYRSKRFESNMQAFKFQMAQDLKEDKTTKKRQVGKEDMEGESEGVVPINVAGPSAASFSTGSRARSPSIADSSSEDRVAKRARAHSRPNTWGQKLRSLNFGLD